MDPVSGFPLLTLVVFLPAVGAVASLLVPSERRDTSRWVVMLVSATDLILVLLLYMGWIDDPSGSPQFVDGPWTWIATTSVRTGYHLAVDGINLHLLLLTALIVPLVTISSWIRESDAGEKRAVVFWTMIFQTGLLGALTAFDFLLLVAFWMVTILAAFFVVGGGERTSRAATHLAAAGALVAAALLAVTLGLAVHQPSLNLPDLLSTSFSWRTQVWMFWAMSVACGITGAVFPLHLWYPAAQRHLPAAAQILIGSLLLNLGGYGLIRVCLPLFPLAAATFGPAIIGLSTAGILYASLAALGHQRLPGVLAYWNVAQVGFVVIGIFCLQDLGLYGAVMSMVANSLAASTLQLLSMDDPEGRDQPGGENETQGWVRAARALGLLSAVGTPGLIGFLGKGLLVIGIARWQWQPGQSTVAADALNWSWYAIIIVGVLLGTWALVRATLHTHLFSASSQSAEHVLIVLPLLILIVVVGLRPALTSDVADPAIRRLLEEVRLGMEQDLLQMAPPLEPGEITEPPAAIPDEGQTTSWALTGAVYMPAPFRPVGHLVDGL